MPNHQALAQLTKQYFLHTTAEVRQTFDAPPGTIQSLRGKLSALIHLFAASDKELTPTAFAEPSGVTRATITVLIDGLEKEDLVKLQPDPEDRQKLTILLTDRERELILKMFPDCFDRNSNMMSNLTATQKKTFIKLLSKLSVATSAMRTFKCRELKW